MRFARKKSSIEILEIAQLEIYYVRGVGLPFADLYKDLAVLYTELNFHGHIGSIAGRVLECRQTF